MRLIELTSERGLNMIFKITSAGNNSTFGDLLFSRPTAEEEAIAQKTVAALCESRAQALYGDTRYLQQRLETELSMMHQTETAYHFLVLKEMVDLSREEGYPWMFEGNIGGSVIAFLLGLTSLNPMPPHYRCDTAGCTFSYEQPPKSGRAGVDLADKRCPVCGAVLHKEGFSIASELVWGSTENPKAPDFSVEIAAPVRPLIHSRLDKAFGVVKSDTALYRQITLIDSVPCECIGKLAAVTQPPLKTEIYRQDVYVQVLKNIADLRERSFEKELKRISSCDMDTLIRIYGYLQGSFSDERTLSRLDNPHFFTLRDDFVAALVSLGMDATTALDVAKKGVWSRGEKRESYLVRLEQYGVPPWLRAYFGAVSNLWGVSPCITRLQLLCVSAWYQLHYPKAFAKCMKQLLHRGSVIRKKNRKT